MDDSAFWRDAADRFLKSDPSGKISLIWTQHANDFGMTFGSGSGPNPVNIGFFFEVLRECSEKNPHPSRYKDKSMDWFEPIMMDPQRYAVQYSRVYERSLADNTFGTIQGIAKACAKRCLELESEGYESDVESVAPPEAEAQRAVCQSPHPLRHRQPRYFSDNDSAVNFLNAEAIHLRAPAGRLDRKNIGWQGPVPISRLSTGTPCHLTFAESYRLEDIPQNAPELTLRERIEQATEGPSWKFQCCLSGEWNFGAIESDASLRQGHTTSIKSRSVLEMAVRRAHDFDAALRRIHPKIDSAGVASFFTSWQFWQYIAVSCEEVGVSSQAENLAGPFEAPKQAMRSREILYEQFSAYAHKLRDSIPTKQSGPIPRPSPGQSSNPRAPVVSQGQLPQYPRRAEWLALKLKERGWDHNDPPRWSGPDRKTIIKLLAGQHVRADVFEKLVISLNKKLQNCTIIEIPND